MIRLIIILLTCSLLIGCSSSKGRKLTDTPVRPEFRQLVRKPVLKYYEEDKNYLVSDEFMERSVQLHKYEQKIEKWKLDNNL